MKYWMLAILLVGCSHPVVAKKLTVSQSIGSDEAEIVNTIMRDFKAQYKNRKEPVQYVAVGSQWMTQKDWTGENPNSTFEKTLDQQIESSNRRIEQWRKLKDPEHKKNIDEISSQLTTLLKVKKDVESAKITVSVPTHSGSVKELKLGPDIVTYTNKDLSNIMRDWEFDSERAKVNKTLGHSGVLVGLGAVEKPRFSLDGRYAFIPLLNIPEGMHDGARIYFLKRAKSGWVVINITEFHYM